MTNDRQGLQRTLGLSPPRIKATTQWLALSFILAMPVAGIAVGMVDPSRVFGIATLFSPGTALAKYLDQPQDPRLGGGSLGTILSDVVTAMSKFIWIAWSADVVYFGLLIYSIVLLTVPRAEPNAR